MQDGISEDGPRGFNIFYWGTVPVVRTLHLPTMVRSFLCELETMLVADRDDGVYLRAVPVRSETMLGIIPMTLHLTLGDQSRRAARSGLSVGETMTVVVDEDGRIGPVPERLSLPSDAHQRLLDIAVPGIVADRKPLDEPVTVDAIYAMDRDAAAEPESFVKEAPRALSLYRMLSWVLNVDHATGGALRPLEALVRDARCYSVLPVSNVPGLLTALARGLDRTTEGAGAATA